MSFYVVINSTTAVATDINDNFLHVRQGTVYPYLETTAGSLSLTTDKCDIGTAANTWNNVYCNYVDFNTITTSRFVKIVEYVETAASSKIEVTGLTGAQKKFYDISIFLVLQNTCTIYMYVNGDSTAANYGQQALYAETATSFAARSSSTGWFLADYNPTTTIGEHNFIKMSLAACDDTEKISLYRISNGYLAASATVTALKRTYFIAGSYKVTAGTITSIQITSDNTGSIGVGSYITIWGKR